MFQVTTLSLMKGPQQTAEKEEDSGSEEEEEEEEGQLFTYFTLKSCDSRHMPRSI